MEEAEDWEEIVLEKGAAGRGPAPAAAGKDVEEEEEEEVELEEVVAAAKGDEVEAVAVENGELAPVRLASDAEYSCVDISIY